MSVYHVDEQHLMSVTSVEPGQQFDTGLALDILFYQQIFELPHRTIIVDKNTIVSTTR